MNNKLFILAFLASSSAFAQQLPQADSTLIGQNLSGEIGQYIQQQTTQQQTTCPSAVLQWGNSGTYCRQGLIEAQEGYEAYLIDQDPADGSAGSARFFCQAGNWIMTASNCSAIQTVQNPVATGSVVTQSPYTVPDQAEPTTNTPYHYCPPNYICNATPAEPSTGNNAGSSGSIYDTPVYYYQSQR